MVVSERFPARGEHPELKRNVDFCDKISSFFGVMSRTCGPRFRLRLSVVCSDFLICGCTKMCLTYKNTGLQNDCAHFEQFTVEHLKRIIAMAANRSQNPLGAVLLYKLSALRVM